MNYRIKIYTKNAVLSLLALLGLGLFYSCSTDSLSEEQPKDDLGTERVVTFSVQVPGPALPKTYAWTEADENQVREIDVLLFDEQGNFTGDILSADQIKTDVQNSSIKYFTVNIPKGKYQVTVLANSRKAIADAGLSSLPGGSSHSKSAVLNKLEVAIPEGYWPEKLGVTSMAIPMWGEISLLEVGENTSLAQPIQLVRMLAKINVRVDITLQSDFTLTSVRVGNRYTSGLIVPFEENWNASEKRVTKASVLPSWTRRSSYLLYSTKIGSVLDRIYLFEARLSEDVDVSEVTMLIVGGRYKGSNDETFYRVDFAKKTTTGLERYDLLRNHLYDFNIKKISGAGYDDQHLAAGAEPINIEVDMSIIDNSKITQAVYDGQYMLAVSSDRYSFSSAARTSSATDNTLSITADYSKGWKSEIVETSGDWLSLNRTSSATAGTTDQKIILSKNTTNASRTGKIKLTSGRLSMIITVVQSAN